MHWLLEINIIDIILKLLLTVFFLFNFAHTASKDIYTFK